MIYHQNDIKEMKRGNIFYIANSKYYSTDPENEAGRPGIIVSCDELNKHSTVVEVVYLTTKEKLPMPTHTAVMCKVPSTVLCETIYTVTKDRVCDYIRTCTDKEMEAIDRCMLNSLGISALVAEREREKSKILKQRILPNCLSRRIFIKCCTNSFLIE